jgi:hypothetical protein
LLTIDYKITQSPLSAVPFGSPRPLWLDRLDGRQRWQSDQYNEEAMNLFVAGVCADGRSGVIQRTSLQEGESSRLWKTKETPPKIDRPTSVPAHPARCAPGETTWQLVSWPANTVREMHRTDLLSYNLVVSGSVELVLETESVHLRTGDCLVCLGVIHGWRAGEEGVTLSSSSIGLEP